ncbi:uncharacterized protein LOC129730760 isoform X2 [Wyeomyia smithii]|uniref:uncharacterized protein LOC129730760 isoform X2 n=1 Tax=Wyeomyia smithii TaxID=174621 RepID=UPI0024681B3F|nr:uncharacterized protein LOC129730760 isoform X2 [Wyeomyia smithii]
MSKTTVLSVTGTTPGGIAGGGSAGGEFDVPGFEQRLRDLKDTQDSIQQLSAWCLQRRAHHKKIVSSWLNVLKQVKVESRLTLFYLANDVIQYSKRKNYEYVDSWGTYLQKATTLVRDEKVKHKILRIFRIWEQREIYNDEFLADLNGLLSATSAKKTDSSSNASISGSAGSTGGTTTATLATGPTRLVEAKNAAAAAAIDIEDFQTASLVSIIKECVKNETDTDTTFKSLNKTPSLDVELVKNSIKGKDRKRVEDIEREIEENLVHYQSYVHSLKTELKSRRMLLTLLEQAETFYHNQRGEVKVVANAYRNFGNRLKSMKKKLDELTTTLPSPIPSPDINAPSPEPDMDLQLPDDQSFFNVNGMMNSYMDGNLPFDINDFRRDSPTASADSNNQSFAASRGRPGAVGHPIHSGTNSSGPYVPSHSSNSSLEEFANGGTSADYTASLNSYGVPSSVVGTASDYGLPSLVPRQNNHHPVGMNRPFNSGPQYNQPMLSDYSAGRPQPVSRGPLLPPPAPVNLDRSDEYNSTWDMSMTWDGPHDQSGFQNLDTPVSPPHYERKGINSNVIEYIDGANEDEPLQDVDHRQLPNMPIPAFLKDKGRLMDVDHRNLISLTGSPGPLLKSSLDDLEDIDDDDEDADLLLEADNDNDTESQVQSTTAVVEVEKSTTNSDLMSAVGSFWGSGGDVDLRHASLLQPPPPPVPAPTVTTVSNSSNGSSTTTTTASETKDLDLRIQSIQKAIDSHFGASTDNSKSGEDTESNLSSLQLLQTPTSLLEIDDFLQNFERENFDLSKPPSVLMSNQSEVSLSPPPSLLDADASTPKRTPREHNNDTPQNDEKDPAENNESVDMDLSDEEYVPEHPTESTSGKSGTSSDKPSASSPRSSISSLITVVGSSNSKSIAPASGTTSVDSTINSLSAPLPEDDDDIPLEDSTEPYEPFEGEDVDDPLTDIPDFTENVQSINTTTTTTTMTTPTTPTVQQARPPLLPDPEFPPSFAFQQQQQQHQSQQQKPWELAPPPLNNFGNPNIPSLADLANFGDFPSLAAGLSNFNQPPPNEWGQPLWNNQMGGPNGGIPMGGGLNHFGNPNRAPFGGSPFGNNKNNFRNQWPGGRGGGNGGGGGPRHGSPYFRGGAGGNRGGGRGNFRGFRGGGGHHNNRGGNWD